jgi:hypothetical protein
MKPLEHGGTQARGRRKNARPIDPRRALYVVLSSRRATGKRSLRATENVARVSALVRSRAKHYGVRLFAYSNTGREIHLLVQGKRRAELQSFLRTLPGGVAMIVTGARKGKPFGKFWEGTAFSRIVDWGEDFEALKRKLNGLGRASAVRR